MKTLTELLENITELTSEEKEDLKFLLAEERGKYLLEKYGEQSDKSKWEVIRARTYEELVNIINPEVVKKNFPETFLNIDKAVLVNGIIELEDEKGNYKGRICDNAVAVLQEGYNIIAVKANGDLEWYSLQTFYGKITDGVKSAQLENEIVSATQ